MTLVTRRLDGVRVVITRPRDRSEELCFLLEDEGAEVMSIPVLDIKPPHDMRPLVAAAEGIQRYRWVVFASPSAVVALADAMREAGTLGRMEHVKLAAVGPRTARDIERIGWKVSAQPEAGTAEALLPLMAADLAPGDEVLLPAAEDGRRELEHSLLELGVHVTRVIAYRTPPAALAPESLVQLEAAPPDVVLFASPRTAELFVDAAGKERLGRSRAVAIGPTTAAGLEQLGLEVAAVAERPTSEALVEAAVHAMQVRS